MAHPLKNWSFSVYVSSDNWEVKIECNGETRAETFDWVVCTTGRVGRPIIPKDIKHQEAFMGKVLHSSEYTGPESFKGKKVLVIGPHESGSDIVGEIAESNDTNKDSLFISRRSPIFHSEQRLFLSTTRLC
eukprot:TRINITY_DN1736_c1_g1_i2.p2 TRINITY_DN1736_c1_g1~~TRINITY_DN1736_c1_g1_i2.p2  ORF type:complete len:131 (+),score=28.13 TRINITY_DN1736_c1_g1_i2:296-688(+)